MSSDVRRPTVRYVPDPSDPDNPIRCTPATRTDTWNLTVPAADIDVALLCDEKVIAAIRIALPPIGPDGP